MSENFLGELESQLEALPEKVFAAGAEEYNKRGFKLRVGYGTRTAIIPACKNLGAAARAKGVPILFTTPLLSMNNKVPVNN